MTTTQLFNISDIRTKTTRPLFKMNEINTTPINSYQVKNNDLGTNHELKVWLVIS